MHEYILYVLYSTICFKELKLNLEELYSTYVAHGKVRVMQHAYVLYM